jgi:hypothetical protein
MSTIEADAVTAASGVNTDLSLDGKGTGVPDLGAGFKVGSVAGVPTASIRDDAITTAKILNDNVTLAKLAAGTDGELITWDASGDPAAVAVGTATHVLTSNGAGAAPTFQAAAAGGAWTKIGTAVAADSATLTVTGLDSTYDTYACALSDIKCPTDGSTVRMRVGDSGGMETGITYRYHRSQTMSSGVGYSGAADQGINGMNFSNDLGNATGEGLGAMLFLHRPGDGSARPIVSGSYMYTQSQGYVQGGQYAAQFDSVITLDRLDVSLTVGNIVSGRFTVWGISHA